MTGAWDCLGITLFRASCTATGCPDLVNSKGKPLIKNGRLKTVWTRLADHLSTVISDTSMMTISSAYSAHFSDMHINGKENAKLTGDRMKMLMLSLPLVV